MSSYDWMHHSLQPSDNPARLPATKWQIQKVEEYARYNGKLMRWEIRSCDRVAYAVLEEDLKPRGWESDHLMDLMWRTRGF